MDKNIFIIEDDVNISSGLKTKFSLAGFNIGSLDDEEADIEDYINSIKKFNTDVIVLDLILPNIDGFEIIKEIRKDAEISDAYIFVFTDVSDKDSKARGLQLGVNQYLLKDDFSIDEFTEKVQRIIENKEAMTDEDILV